MMLNSKAQNQPVSKKERLKEQEQLKAKVNKLFDLRASDPLIINRLKRTDSVFDKVKLLNENYFNSGRGNSTSFLINVIESIKKKRLDIPSIIEDLKEEEEERDKAAAAQDADAAQQLLTTEGLDDSNNSYFRVCHFIFLICFRIYNHTHLM